MDVMSVRFVNGEVKNIEGSLISVFAKGDGTLHIVAYNVRIKEDIDLTDVVAFTYFQGEVEGE